MTLREFDEKVRFRVSRALLRASRAVFTGMHNRYWAGIERSRKAAPDRKVHDRLAEDGIVMLPGWVDAGEVERARREVAALDGFESGRYTGPIPQYRLDHDGVVALEVTEALPTCYRLTRSPYVETMATSLYGAGIHLTAASLLCKYDASKVDASAAPHWDDWRVRFKAFVYLDEVTPEQAPMVYCRGSHNGRIPWRLDKDFASWQLPHASAGGSWWPVDELGFEKVSCTGPAGTLVLFDARGIHAATQLVRGRRLMLMSMYTTHMPYSFRPY